MTETNSDAQGDAGVRTSELIAR